MINTTMNCIVKSQAEHYAQLCKIMHVHNPPPGLPHLRSVGTVLLSRETFWEERSHPVIPGYTTSAGIPVRKKAKHTENTKESRRRRSFGSKKSKVSSSGSLGEFIRVESYKFE